LTDLFTGRWNKGKQLHW